MRAWLTGSWLALLLAAGFSCAVERGWLGAPVAPDLAHLPARLGPLTLLEEIPFDPAALGETPPERFTFRLVRDEHGHEGRLFLAYYERAQRWSGRPHDLEKCFTADGWEEREAGRLEQAQRPWSRRFERAGDSIRVVHWVERPGPDADRLSWTELASRLLHGRGFRPDAAAIYFEFDSGSEPSPAEAAAAVSALSAALEELW